MSALKSMRQIGDLFNARVKEFWKWWWHIFGLLVLRPMLFQCMLMKPGITLSGKRLHLLTRCNFQTCAGLKKKKNKFQLALRTHLFWILLALGKSQFTFFFLSWQTICLGPWPLGKWEWRVICTAEQSTVHVLVLDNRTTLFSSPGYCSNHFVQDPSRTLEIFGYYTCQWIWSEVLKCEDLNLKHVNVEYFHQQN